LRYIDVQWSGRMPVFEYRALAHGGEAVRGMITADTPQQARELLRLQGVFPTALKATSRRQRQWRLPVLGGRAWQRDRVTFTRQLGTLLRSGVALAQALDLLARQTHVSAHRRIFLDLAERVRSGSAFAEALKSHADRFDEFYIHMVAAGEESGRLPEMLGRLAGYLKERYRLGSRVSAAMTYPAFMLVVGFAVVTFLMAGVVPRITSVLIEQAGREALPAATRMLLAMSAIFRDWWPAILLGVVGVVIGFARVLALPRARRWWDRTVLGVPVFGDMAQKSALSRFAVTFSALLKSGIPAVESLRLTALTVGNVHVGEHLRQAAERVTQGASLSEAMRGGGGIPDGVAQMVDVGEQSGELPEILDNLAADFDEDLEIAVGRMTALMEPVIILVMAVMVGFIALAIIQPIMEMSRVLN
jgi:type II secretory pathway component PulF